MFTSAKYIGRDGQEYEFRPNFGKVLIDPSSETAKRVAPYCTAGSPTECYLREMLVASFDGLPKGRRPKFITVHIFHLPEGGVDHARSRVGFTYGDMRYERSLTPVEERIAEQFDRTRKFPRRKVAMAFDTRDQAWSVKPKQTHHAHAPRNPEIRDGDTARHSLRKESLKQARALRREEAAAQ